MSHSRGSNVVRSLMNWTVVALLIVAATIPVRAEKSGANAAMSVESVGYRIQPGDMLQISVWKEADLQLDVLVRPDGGITVPLAGNLQASGSTVTQLSEAMAERIRRYIPDPVVTVALKQLGGNHIYVLGKVNRSGEFSFARPLDVMQALSLAGGATPYASLSDIRVLRRENGEQKVFKFDYNDVERGKGLDKNIVLQSGDVVVVP